ncbi:hypothetical protein [Sinomonas sp. P10A9]|uniref:Uncharacterized protein n=1 Tax=Sinomonas puerhi TaxID=3238584 RepID=A0AB39L5Q5_9MICC
MKIEVIRSGGVAGIPRSGAVEFGLRGDAYDPEWASLYRAARQERAQLFAPAGSAASTAGEERHEAAAAPSHVRDAFHWTLRFGRERFDVPDGTLQGALRELAEKVLAEGT